MGAITDGFGHNHKLCDDLWVAAEDAVASGKWDAAAVAWKKFQTTMELHLGTEETQLFPAFEEATGMVGGPTAVMRMEHTQMRELFAELAEAVAKKDAEGFNGAGQTMLILMQQHNMKEEQMLYPMCDRALEGEGPLVDRLLGAIGAR